MRLPWYVPLALVCALAVAIYVAVLGWQRAGAEKREAARVAESHHLELAGIQQAAAVREADLRAEQNLAQRRLGDALAAAGVKSTPIVTVSGSTGPVQTGGPGLTPQSPGAVHAPGPAPSSGAVERACLLYAGEEGEIRVTSAAARTDKGNVAFDAQADAYGGGRLLFGGPLKLNVKYLSPREPGPRGTGLGIGGALVLTRDGFLYGPAIASPSFRALWLEWNANAALTLNTRGDWALTGTIIARGSK